MTTPVSNVYPGSLTATHEVALRRPNGQMWGLRLKEGAASIRNIAPQTQAPFQQIKQFSFHQGRGWENYLGNNHLGYWDAKDAWTLTPSKLHAVPLMQWAYGLRSQDTHWLQTGVQTEYTNIVWIKIVGSNKNLSKSFVSNGIVAAGHGQFFIRRKGNPQNLTVKTVSDDGAGDPKGTVRQTITITKSDVTDFTVRIFDGEPAAFSFIASSTYHVLFQSTDIDENNCWEIGCNPDVTGRASSDGATYSSVNYGPYFRLTDADTLRRFFMFMYDGAMYAVTNEGTSNLYINGGRGKATSATATTLVDTALNMTASRYINAYLYVYRGTGEGQVRKITANGTTSFTVPNWAVIPDATSEYMVIGTPWFHKVGATGIDGFTSAAAGAHGLGQVVSMPVVINNIAYYPQGDAVDLRRMRWNGTTKVHDFASETNIGAEFLEVGYDSLSGGAPQIWRVNNAAGAKSAGDSVISRASGVAWGTGLAFAYVVAIGSTTSKINGMHFVNGTVNVHKTDSLYTVTNDRAVERDYGARDMPSRFNGNAMAHDEQFVYFAFWTTLFQLSGGAVVDTKLWLNNLPSNRVGRVLSLEAAFGWVFFAYFVPASIPSGESSTLIWNNKLQAFHEVLRSWEVGRQIMDVFWQPCEDTNPRLWHNIGGDLVYQVFPRSPRPIADPDIPFQPEFVFETSTIDLLNSNSKYFGTLSAVTKNLNNNGHVIEVDYQTDDDVGTSKWIATDALVRSPEDASQIATGNKKKLRLRFRGLAKNLKLPPVIENWGLSLFERTEPPRYFTIQCKTSPQQKVKNGGADDHKPDELLAALEEMNKTAEVLKLFSIDKSLHEKQVTMYLAPKADKERYANDGKWTGDITVYLFKEAEHAEL